MVVSRANKSNPARIPALGFRMLFLIFLSILLMIVDHRFSHLQSLRKVLDVAVYPLQVVVDAPFRVWWWLRDATVTRTELRKKLDLLEDERMILKAELQTQAALRAENQRLRDLLDARARVRDAVRVAEIMAVDANPYGHSFIIDVGGREGAFNGQALVDSQGVIGQIIRTSPMSSQAILVTHPSHALPVEVNRNGLRTIAKGTGQIDRLDLPFLPNSADITAGDLLVTSGLGGGFPAGYPVAVVTSVNRMPQEPFADVKATPVAALNQVREVMLIFPSESEVEAESDGD